MRRTAARIDENQPAIVAALQKAGALVLSLAPIGKGVPDLLCHYHGRFVLLEVKNPTKPKADRQLTPAQKVWHAIWPVTVVETVDQALAAIGANHAG